MHMHAYPNRFGAKYKFADNTTAIPMSETELLDKEVPKSSLSETRTAEESTPVVRIPLTDIVTEGLRVDSSTDLTTLATSLLLHGQLTPISVRPDRLRHGKYKIIFGNRRFHAAKKLGWEKIQAKVVNASESDALVMAFSENADRQDFSDYEKALLLSRIHESTGKDYNEVASLLGRSPAYVSQHVAMLHLFSEEVASLAERERALSSLSEGHARVLARMEDPVDRWNTAKLAVASHMGVRELERICSKGRRDSKGMKEEENKTIPELIKDIIKGTTSTDIRPFSEILCPEHFTMFSSWGNLKAMGTKQSIDHVCQAVSRVKAWDQRIEDLTIRTVGAVSYTTMLINHRMAIRGGQVAKAKTRATLIFEREGKAWKLTHGHWSSARAEDAIHLKLEARSRG